MSGSAPAPARVPTASGGGFALRFRLGGVPVRIDPSFLVIAVLIGLGRPPDQLLAWVGVVVFAVLLHEMGHAVAFKAFGQHPHIRLTSLVGLTTGSGPVTRWQDVITRVAGPLVGLVGGALIIVFVEVGSLSSPFWRQFVGDLLFALIGWSLLNLLPILPLDGGGIMAALLGGGQDPRRQRIAHVISASVAAAAALAAFSVELVFAGLLAAFFCYSNITAVTSDRRQDRLLGARDALAAGDPEQAAALLADLPARQEELPLRASVAVAVGQPRPVLDQMCRWHGLGEGADDVDAQGAVQQLTRSLARESPGHVVGAHILLHADGRYATAVELAEEAWGIGVRHPFLALNAACSSARVGDPEAGLRWLWRAAELGVSEIAAIDNDPELASVRALPEYEHLRRAMTDSP